MAVTEMRWHGAQALADMPATGFHRMLCIEAALMTQPVALAPEHTWSGEHCLRMPDTAAP